MDDEELIYLFIDVQNDWAFNYLYQKYQNLIKIITRKAFAKFFTLPLELNDLESTIYFVFYQSIINFQFKRNKSFRNFLLINLNWKLIKYLKKYITRNHQILNLALSYHDYFINKNLSYQNNFFNNDFFDWSNLKLSFYERNVLKLKYQGFSNQEIMIELNLNYKQVDNAFQRGTSKLRNIIKD